MSQSQTEPLLNIQTLITRPRVDIDGVAYAMLSPGELSVIESVRFIGLARRIGELQEAIAGGDTDDGLTDELDLRTSELAGEVLIAVPDEVLAKLSGMHKIRIAEVFIMLLLRDRLAAAGAAARNEATGTRTGARRSRAFSGSSGVARANGWKARLSRWLGLT